MGTKNFETADKDRTILDSWKEISTYLERSEKTCRKWEKEFDLPVHRIENSPKARVFAFKDELDNWLNAYKDVSSLNKRKKFSDFLFKKKVWIGIALLLILGVFSYVNFFYLRNSNSEIKTSTNKPSLAVVCFENRSGDKELDYLGDAFQELLSTDLSQSKYLHVLRSDQIYEIYNKLKLSKNKYCSERDLKNIAKKGRVKNLLHGSYVKAGEKFLITSKLINAITGRTLSSQLWEASNEQELFPRIDDITRKVKLSLKILPEQLRDDLDEDISKVSTNSTKALKYYVEGLVYFKELQYEKSIKAMKKAVLEDSNFAMAYRNIAAAYRNMGRVDPDKYYLPLKKAIELKEHITLREYLIIKGDYYSVNSINWEEALKSYRKLFDLYPEDVYVIKLVAMLVDLERYQEALKICKTYFQLYPNLYAYSNLGFIYSGKREYKKAIELMKDSIGKFPGNDFYFTNRLALLYMSNGQYQKALEYNKRAKNCEYFQEIKGNILWLMEDFQGARSEYLRLFNSLKNTFKRLHILGLLGYLHLAHGKFQHSNEYFLEGLKLSTNSNDMQMISQFNQDIAISYLKSGNSLKALKIINKTIPPIQNKNLIGELFFLHDKGMILIENNIIDEAKLIIEKMEVLKKDWMSDTFYRLSNHLKGLIEIKRNNYSEAIKLLTKAVSLIPGQDYLSYSDWYRAEIMEQLAKAYYLSDDLKNALAEYERITKLTSARLVYGDVYPRSFYMLGKIYERLGNRNNSIKSYRKFISLWKGCDEQFQYMVKNAEKGIASQQKINL